MIRISILFALFALAAFQLGAQTPQNITVNQQQQPTRVPCPDNLAGTISFDFAGFSGQSNDIDPDTIFLCMGDTLPIIHNGDFVLTDPDPSTPSGVGYAFYDCRPTVDGPDLDAIRADPCLNTTSPLVYQGFNLPQTQGIWVAAQNPNGNLDLINNGFHQEAFNMGMPAPIQLWFAPITIDNFIGPGYDGDDGSCVSASINEAFSVVYLESIQITEEFPEAGPGLQGAFSVEGGLPEFDPTTSYTNISIVSTTPGNPSGTVITTNGGHGDTIFYTVPRPGEYEVTIEDGKSCALIDTIEMPVIFSAGTANGMPGDAVCVPVQVNNFVDVVGAQFTMQWDPTIIRFTNLQNLNTSLPGLDIGSAFNITPALTDGGMLTFNWFDIFGNSNSLPDGAILFEVCFEVIGNLGSSSPVGFTNMPTDIQVGNPSNTPDAYPFLLSPGQVNVTNEVLLLETSQDSVSCANFMDGAFTLTVSGGVAPYSFTYNTFPPSGPEIGPFNINQSGDSLTVSNLSPGDYRIIVQDAGMPANLDTTFVEVFEGVELGASLFSVQDPTCNGFDDGIIQAQVSIGGVVQPNPGPNISFTWNPAAPDTSTLIDVPSGPYSVTVTDGNGCMANASITLSQPPALQLLAANTFITNATCSGSMDGSILAGASGGTTDVNGNYNYTWSFDPGNTITASTSQADMLNAGTYSLTVTDDSGCELIRPFTVGAVKTLSINAFVTDVTCNGDNDGQIQASGSATGAPPFGAYTFSWSNGPMTATNTNLGAGQYILTLTDSDPAGCQVVDTFTVVEPALLQIIDPVVVNETCDNGGGDGSITISVTGGVYPYTYTWSDGQMDSTATNLVQNNYTVNVEDANGCTDSESFFISAPTPPSIDLLENDTLSCSDDTNGSLTAVATPGGAAIDTYSWSNNQTTPTITGLSPGTYTVTVTAVDGCFSVGTAEVVAPAPLAIDSIVAAAPNCPGDDNGSLTVFASGGTAPLTYIWANSPQNDTFQFNLYPGLSAGNYQVSVTDANGCGPALGLGTVNDPPAIEITFSDTVGVSCFEGVCDGRATATAMYSNGTTSLFNFSWESGETNAGAMASSASQLCKGEQTLVVTDNRGCFSTTAVFISSPEDININADIQPVTCFGQEDGTINLEPFGGTPGYTYNWTSLGVTTPMVSNLAAGSYNVIVTDANNCQKEQELVVTEPDELILTVDQALTRDASCFDSENGVLAVQYNTNDQVTYTWSANLPLGSSSPTSPVAQNLPAGTYSVTITNQSGCQDSLSYSIGAPDEVVAIVMDPEDPLCFNSTTKVFIDTVYGGVGTMPSDYQYQVDNNGIRLPIDIPADIFGDGDHDVEVFDPNGCSTIVTVNIDQPDEILVTFPEDIVVVELGDTLTQLQPIITPLSTQIDSFIWSPTDYLSSPSVRNPFVKALGSLEYTLTVVDINGCEGVGSVFVELDANRNIYIPNVFSPNGDGVNDEFRVFPCVGVTDILSVHIFDRWGDLVYQNDGQDVSNNIYCAGGLPLWDGRFNSEDMNPGVYVYIIEVEFLDQVRLVYRGDVSILR